MQERKHSKKNNNFSNVNYCNVIIRAYLQKCKTCKTEGKAQLNERAFKKIVILASEEIFKFYGIRPIFMQEFPAPRNPGLKKSDHYPDLCLAC